MKADGKPDLPSGSELATLKSRLLNCGVFPRMVFLTKRDFWDAHREFHNHFLYQENRGVGVYDQLVDRQVFGWHELSDLADNVSGNKMLLIYLGLEGRTLTYGFKIVPYEELGSVWTYQEADNPSHVLRGTDFVRLNDPTNDWQGYRNEYLRRVSILRENGDLEVPDLTNDARYIAIPWEEIRCMHDQTVSIGMNYQVAIRSLSTLSDGDGGREPIRFYHTVAIYLERIPWLGGAEAMLDNNHHVAIAHFKAADLGNRCPPRCREYTLPNVRVGFDHYVI